MENSLIYTVEEDYEKLKIREYLKQYQNLSSRLLKSAARERRVKVNGEVVRMNYLVQKGDKIEVNINKVETQNIEPEKMDIDVVYEDIDIIVLNKRPGMVVHPTRSHQTGTLSNGLRYYFKETGQKCIVRLVNRLDMDTSGLVIVAKNQFSHMALSREMQENNVEKCYMAICHGNINNKQGTIDELIGRPTLESIKREVMEEGQKSITHYKVMERFDEADLVELRLETGRTHQIRVHLSHLGHPIYGDVLYGVEEREFIDRQALHAYKLVFPHPKTGEKISLKCDIPADMKELLEKLNK